MTRNCRDCGCEIVESMGCCSGADFMFCLRWLAGIEIGPVVIRERCQYCVLKLDAAEFQRWIATQEQQT